MIDWWLLFSLNILALTMAFHTYLAHVVSKARPLTEKSGDCLICKIKSAAITYKGKDKVSNFQMEESAAMSTSEQSQKDMMINAKRINTAGKIIFILICVFFNLVFWVLAINEYKRPAEEYIYP
jgi:hypothetical protein